MTFGALDIVVVVVYFLAVMGTGLWFGRNERGTHDFFLGGRRQNWIVVGLSIVATEVSALTFLVVPGRAYESDWWYLQTYIGSLVGRLLIIVLLLPAFYRGSVTTVYEYLGQRFGAGTRMSAALMFFASRLVGSGIRLLAASLAISLVFNWPLEWVVFAAAGIAVAYTTFGGIKAVIWTDALQAVVFLASGVAVLVFLFLAIPGAWGANLSSALDAGKLTTFHWSWNPNDTKAFWVLIIWSTVQTMAALGADQDLTQRMLTCPDVRKSQRAMMLNAFLGLPLVCLFLLVGSLMFVYYTNDPTTQSPTGDAAARDRVFIHFISTALPVGYGLKGLLVAGIFAAAMSSLDSALGALSSTAVTDFYRPYVRQEAPDRHYLLVARLLTFFFGVLLAAIALAFRHSTGLLEDAFSWAGLMFGGMLGVFVLGVTTKTRGGDLGNVLAMWSSVLVLVAIKVYQDRTGSIVIAWPWWVVIGTGWTCVFGAMSRTRK